MWNRSTSRYRVSTVPWWTEEHDVNARLAQEGEEITVLGRDIEALPAPDPAATLRLRLTAIGTGLENPAQEWIPVDAVVLRVGGKDEVRRLRVRRSAFLVPVAAVHLGCRRDP
jgi:hypothetical protein